MAVKFVAVLAICGSAGASDILSDLTISSADQGRALEIKSERFWQGLLNAAEGMKMEEHLALYTETESVIASLPKENTYVRDTLNDVLERLRRTDRALLLQRARSEELASDRLAAPAGTQTASFSFLSGENIFSMALRRFVGEGEYSDKLTNHVKGRQVDILPLLQDTAASTGNILTDCRLATKGSFDVLKYDLYNKGVPKTPENAKVIAYRLVDASGETRKRFMNFVVGAVTGIAEDTKGKSDRAEVTVMQASLEKSSKAFAAVGGAGGAEMIINL